MNRYPRESAPRKHMFLGKMKDYPWLCMVVYNSLHKEWCYTRHTADLFQGKEDDYFENEYAPIDQLEWWINLKDLMK